MFQFLFLFLFTSIAFAEEKAVANGVALAKKKVVITIDDEPFGGSSLFPSATSRAQKILETLTQLEVPTVGIFVVGQHMKNIGDDSVKLYGNSKRAVISNHTYGHLSLNRVGSEAYISDIKKLDAIIRGMPGFQPFFRYPYLAMGTGKSYGAVEGALHSMGYTSVPVTIDNKDYYVNSLLQSFLSKKRKVNYDKLRDVYIKHMMGCVHYAEAVHDNQSGAHVLLMHANDVTALYLGDLIHQLRKEGWEIVSILDERQYVKRKNAMDSGIKDTHTQNVGWVKTSLQAVID